MFIRRFFLFILLFTLVAGLNPAVAQRDPDAGPLLEWEGKPFFVNGINIAWIDYSRDMTHFNELKFVRAMHESSLVSCNTVRWWLHTNGMTSPLYGDDGKVIGLGEYDIANVKRGLDLAYERGLLVYLSVWSYDMMQVREGVNTEANKMMLEDPEYTQAYIDNALIPLVTALKDHPGIIAWEVINEPEGMVDSGGWTDERTSKEAVQQFANLLAGAIHRTDPDALVTVAANNMLSQTDVDGNQNWYTNERLVAAGGDPDGTLDFYSVHFYPEWIGDSLSPFHNPYSHWELDKPLVVSEFPAAGLEDLGMGYHPTTELTSEEAYSYLYENGYAGALAWHWQGDQHGTLLNAAPGIIAVKRMAGDAVRVEIGEVDFIPLVVAPIANLVARYDDPPLEIDLATVFEDKEDGTNLTFEVVKNSDPATVGAAVESNILTLTFSPDVVGLSDLAVKATDSFGNSSQIPFTVQVVDPNFGNIALSKPAVSSTEESSRHLAEYATDGSLESRWSTEFADDQWLIVDLEAVFDISSFVLNWETAFGKHYEVQIWDGAEWQTIITELESNGGIDQYDLDAPIQARYVRVNAIERGTEWGFSLWEFEVIGMRAEGDFPDLEVAPPDAPVSE